jgi:NAD(P)-dependent dehydrogenase (short-subunit alcohol dehydrogenase family)
LKTILITGAASGIGLATAKRMASHMQVVIADRNYEAAVVAADAIKSAGLGTGQGFTDKDLKFLQGIAGGTINLTAQTLTNLAELQHRAATRSAESWNKRVKEVPSEVLKGTGLSTTPITVAPLTSGAANIVVTPDGQSHRFPTPAAAAQFKKDAGL